MSTTEIAEETNLVADVQSQLDNRQISINRVGIKSILHPLTVKQKNGEIQPIHAKCDMTITLNKNQKGTHMSRFVEILHAQNKPLTITSMAELLHSTAKKLQSSAAQININFPYFLKKQAPISKVESYLDYQVGYFGEIKDNKTILGMEVLVPISSLCPCSKEISDYGAHNQRSHIKIKVHVKGLIWLEELIHMVEKEASCELYGLLKRVDEKYVTEYAYDNPKFVEDLVRDLAMHLNRDERISYYYVSSENFESIHNHSAYAEIEKQK